MLLHSVDANVMRLLFAVAALAAVLVAWPRPTAARVVVWGGFGYPFYGVYPYGAYPFYPSPYAYPPPIGFYPYAYYPYSGGTPPPGYAPGHWERRQDGAGNPIEVWVPQHLR